MSTPEPEDRPDNSQLPEPASDTAPQAPQRQQQLQIEKSKDANDDAPRGTRKFILVARMAGNENASLTNISWMVNGQPQAAKNAQLSLALPEGTHRVTVTCTCDGAVYTAGSTVRVTIRESGDVKVVPDVPSRPSTK